MKVAITIGTTDGKGGGMGRVTSELVRKLSEHIDVLLCYPGPGNTVKQISETLSICTIQSISDDEIVIPITSNKNIKFLNDQLELFNPDLIHMHDISLMSYACQSWGKSHGKGLLFTAHYQPSRVVEYGSNEFLDDLAGQLAKAFVDQYSKGFLKKCDAFIVLHDSIREDIDSFVDGKPYFHINNGRDIDKFNTDKDCKKVHGNLLYIGHLCNRKNQLYLLEVMRYLPEFKLRLVGKPLNSEYQDLLEAKIAEYDLKNVELLGQVDFAEVPGIFADTQFFLSASTLEVQSLVIIEALASGTPVIGLNNETVSALVNPTVGINLPSGTNPEDFAGYVKALYSLEKEEYMTMSLAARQLSQQFAWPSVIAKTLAVYEEIRAAETEKRKVNLVMPALVAVGSTADLGIRAYKQAKKINKKLTAILD